MSFIALMLGVATGIFLTNRTAKKYAVSDAD